MNDKIMVEFRSDSAWNVPRLQLHDQYEINLTLMDAGKFFLEGRVYQLRRGTLFTISSEQLHRNMSTDLGYKRYVIKFSPNIVQNISTDQTDLLACFHAKDPVLQLKEEQINDVLGLVKKLAEVIESQPFGADVLQRVILVEILVVLNQIAKAESSQVPLDFPGSVASLSPILKYVNENIAEPLPLAEIAAQFFISKSHLCSIFKKTVGLTVNDYILHRRVLLSKQLMDTNISLLEISNQCGFNSYTSFARSFKKVTGNSPKEYRKKLAQNRYQGNCP